MSDLIKSLLFRLRNGFVAGFLGVFLTSTAYNSLSQGVWNFGDLEQASSAALAAGVAAIILTLDKWVRETWDIKY